MRNQTVLVVLGGLGVLLGAGFLVADDAPFAPAGFDRHQRGEHPMSRLGTSECQNQPIEISWEVFDPTPRPLEIAFNAGLVNCLDLGEDGIIDLDGDGVVEQLQEDNAGVEFYGSPDGSSYPLLVLRHRDEGLAIGHEVGRALNALLAPEMSQVLPWVGGAVRDNEHPTSQGRKKLQKCCAKS